MLRENSCNDETVKKVKIFIIMNIATSTASAATNRFSYQLDYLNCKSQVIIQPVLNKDILIWQMKRKLKVEHIHFL